MRQSPQPPLLVGREDQSFREEGWEDSRRGSLWISKSEYCRRSGGKKIMRGCTNSRRRWIPRASSMRPRRSAARIGILRAKISTLPCRRVRSAGLEAKYAPELRIIIP